MSFNLSQNRFSLKKTPQLDSESSAKLCPVNLNLSTPMPGPQGMPRKLSMHQASKVESNPAKQSALRFKEQIFGRKKH